MLLTDKQKADGRQLVKFGDVAREVTASSRDPLGEGIERYVGLEHIDPESLRLARYGLIAEDNPTFTKKFSAGDILFGRRRAYLKKAVVADFDGICSGDITVIAPKGDVLVPDLLPFIVQSDSFFDWAVKHSAGGLSPRTKFKSLAGYEFLLPSRFMQEKILEVLWKFEDNLFQSDEVIIKGHIFLEKIVVDSIFTKNENDALTPLHCFVKEIREHFTPNENSPVLPYVGFEHIDSGSIQINNSGCSSDVHSNKLYFQKGDILYGKIRPYLKKTGLVDVDGICSSDIVVLRPLNDSAKNLLSVIIKTDYFSKLAMNTASGSKMPRANWSVLSKTMINKTAIEKNELNECVENTLQVIEQAKVNQDKCIAMKSKVVEELFQFH